MSDLFGVDTSPENVLIYDTNNKRRTELAVEVVDRLHQAGWTVYAFAGQDASSYRKVLPDFFVRRHTPVYQADVTEVLEAQKIHGKVAVVVHGLLAPGSKPMNRLLKSEDLFVLTVSSVRAVRGDHRYARVWNHQTGWKLRGEVKSFAVVPEADAPPPPPSRTWGEWVGLW